MNGTQTSYSAKVTVNVPVVLTGASVSFPTTDEDKDGDTFVTVNVMAGPRAVATLGGTFGHFNDNSNAGPFGLAVVEPIRKDALVGAGRAQLIESPNGHRS